MIYNFEKDDFRFYLNEAIQREEVRTISAGRSQILPNGSLLIEKQTMADYYSLMPMVL